MREFPFTAEVLESLTGHYVLAVWPLPAIAPLLALAAVALALRPGCGRPVSALLAAAWAGVGIDFQINTAATIDFLAPLYGACFLGQAVLLAWTGLLRDRLPGGRPVDAAAWFGLVVCIVAIAGYPLIALLGGRSWPSLPIVGVTPDPTILLTLGLPLFGRAPPPLHLLIVPAVWSLVAGTQGWMLGQPERLLVPAAAFTAVILAFQARRTRAAARVGPR